MTLPPDPRRWLPLVAAAVACTALYLAFELGGFAAADVSGSIVLWAAIPIVVIVAFLAAVAIRLSAQIAELAGVRTDAIVGLGRSAGVPVSIGVQLLVLFIALPLLEVLSRHIGLHGTTDVPLQHRSQGVVLLVAWAAILIAPWMEEVSMRGFLLSGLTVRLGFWPAAVISSFVWAGLHGVGGVLIPFLAEGVALCWIRRRTGSVRTGIALHASQNTVASLVTGAGAFVIPPLIVVIASLYVTRSASNDELTLRVRRAWAGVGSGSRSLIDRLPALALPPAGAWVAAGVAIMIGVSLVASNAVFDAGGSHVETTGRAVTAFIGIPILCWILLTADRVWGAPATTCLLGALGCIIITLLRLAQIGFDSTTFVAAVVMGYALVCFGLIGLHATTVALRPRIAAGAAGVFLAFSVSPVPYLTTTRTALLHQSLIAYLLAAAAMVTVGLSMHSHGE